MAIPLKYNLRNLAVRRTTTAMTAFSITLTVTVFIVLMALAQGLQSSLTTTGHPLNVIIMRDGSQSETVSFVKRDALQVIRYLHGIAKDDKGEPWVSPEVIVLINLPRRGQVQGSNVTIRGVSAPGPSLRPEFKMVEGRYFRPGLREVVVSKRISERFQNCALGDKLKFAKGYWTVVGLFEAGNSAYNSEIWTDVNDLAQDFDREDYTDVFVRAADASAVAGIQDQVANDRRLHLKPVTERDYYASQTSTAAPIKAFGVCIATFGGLIGCLIALPINGVTTGTTNFVTFSELAFNFRVTPMLLLSAMIFATVMGLLGGFFPAWRASHENIVIALRST